MTLMLRLPKMMEIGYPCRIHSRKPIASSYGTAPQRDPRSGPPQLRRKRQRAGQRLPHSEPAVLRFPADRGVRGAASRRRCDRRSNSRRLRRRSAPRRPGGRSGARLCRSVSQSADVDGASGMVGAAARPVAGLEHRQRQRSSHPPASHTDGANAMSGCRWRFAISPTSSPRFSMPPTPAACSARTVR